MFPSRVNVISAERHVSQTNKARSRTTRCGATHCAFHSVLPSLPSPLRREREKERDYFFQGHPVIIIVRATVDAIGAHHAMPGSPSCSAARRDISAVRAAGTIALRLTMGIIYIREKDVDTSERERASYTRHT